MEKGIFFQQLSDIYTSPPLNPFTDAHLADTEKFVRNPPPGIPEKLPTLVTRASWSLRKRNEGRAHIRRIKKNAQN